MNVSVGPATEAFIVVMPLVPLTTGAPKLPDAAAGLVMSGTSPLRAGVAPPTLPAAVACGAPEPAGAEPTGPPGVPMLAVPLLGIEALPYAGPTLSLMPEPEPEPEPELGPDKSDPDPDRPLAEATAEASAFESAPEPEPSGPGMDPAVGAVPVAAGNEAATEAEAIALLSGQVTVMVAGLPPSPQTAQALEVVVIGMVGAGLSVHSQCKVVIAVVIVVMPCSQTSQTSTQTATTERLDSGRKKAQEVKLTRYDNWDARNAAARRLRTRDAWRRCG